VEKVSYITSFGAGLLSFASPCTLPLVPFYISYITGLTLEELQSKEGGTRETRIVLTRAIAFVLGFSTVFVTMGATATALGKFVFGHKAVIAKVAGVLIVLFGVHLTGIVRIKSLEREKRFRLSKVTSSPIGAYVMGMAFSFGWVPCIGPILGGILAYAAVQDTLLEGVVMLVFYSLGMGLPFILAAIAIGYFSKAYVRIKKYFRIVELISGVLLIVLGILVFFGSLGLIMRYLMRWFPWLGVG
jgi:cytochrome c-type biogenesis protein